PRVLYAFAEQGQLPAFLKATHRRFHTPHFAILLSAAVMLVVTISSRFIYALTISTITRLLTYAATCAALIALRHKSDAPPSIFKAPAGIAVSIVAIALSAWLIASSTWQEARDTAIAAAAGLVFYLVYRMCRRRMSAGLQ